MKPAILCLVLASGCSTTHWEWEAATVLCKNHGGVYEIGWFKTHCIDGKTFTEQALENTETKIIEKSP